jgi:hypothetical protein
MKLSILFVSFFKILSLCSYGQNLDCEKFKNGLFKIVDNKTKTSFIRRYGNRQSEITVGNKDSTTFIVEWIDECTYTLTPTVETRKKFLSLPNNAKLTVQIIQTKNKSYIQNSTSNFSDFKLTSKVIKIQ